VARKLLVMFFAVSVLKMKQDTHYIMFDAGVPKKAPQKVYFLQTIGKQSLEFV